MSDKTKLDVDAIEARANAAARGPWRVEEENVDPNDPAWNVVQGDGVAVAAFLVKRDAEFIASTRDDVPDLVAEVRRLREIIEGGAEPSIDEMRAASDGDGHSFWLCALRGLAFPFCVRIVFDGAGAWLELEGCPWEPLVEGLARMPGGRWWRLAGGAPASRSTVPT